MSVDVQKATEEFLASLHGAVAQEYLRKIVDGEATAADLAGAAKFLKDNGIDCWGGQNESIDSLADSMSFPIDVDDPNYKSA